MRHINCIVCGSSDYKVLFKNRADNFIKLFDNKNNFSQKVICKSCGLVFQNPVFTKEELAHIYLAGAKDAHSTRPTEKFLKDKEYRACDQIKWLENTFSLDGSSDSGLVKRALEVGSSAGILLSKLQKRGWRVEGIEPGALMAQYSRDNFGIDVRENLLEEVELERSGYDLIVLSHVLEHLPDPISSLSKLGAGLKPNGLLYLEVPNINGIWKNFNDQLQSSHLFVPSVNAMRRIASKAGFTVRKIEAKGRIIRCVLVLSGSSRLNLADNYRIMGLRLRLQRLSSRLFDLLSLETILRGDYLSDTIVFTASNFMVTFFSFISSFVIRKVLGPLTMGLYSELMLVLDYCKFHHLGIINALEREVPFYIGKKELNKVEEIKKTSLIFLLLTAINVAAVLFIVSFFGGTHKVGLRFVALLVLLETVISFYEALLQSYRRFKLWSLLLSTIGFLDVLLKVLFVIMFGLYGLLGAMALTGFMTIGAYLRWGKCGVDLTAKIYFKEVIRLLKLGVPLIFFRIMYMISSSVDKLAIIFFLGRLQLGYYSIASLVSNYLILLPKFIYKPLYPKFMEAFGKSENLEDVKNYLIAPNRIFACLYSVLVGLSVIVIPFAVSYFLPRFNEGILAAQIVALAAFFSAFVYTWNFLLIALYKQTRLAILYGVSAVINIVVTLLLVKLLNMRINGVALAVLISQFLFTTLLICYGYRYYTRNLLNHVKLLAMLYYPFAWIVAAMCGSRFYYPKHVSIMRDFLSVAASCLVFLILCAPLIIYMIKREKLSRYFVKAEKKQK